MAGRIALADREGADALAFPVEAGAENPGVVQDQAIAGREEVREFAESAVLPSLLLTVEHEHARCGAILQRLLGNQLLRQVIIEV